MEQKKQTEEKEQPDWLSPQGKVDEVKFCREFYMKHHLAVYNNCLYSPYGRVSDENLLRRRIYSRLSQHVTSGLPAKVESIVSTLLLECPTVNMDRDKEQYMLYTNNGQYNLCESTFSNYMDYCRFRLPVDYNPEAPKPERWLTFLSELLYEEDIPTLQEYMGYCLLPTTIAQKMLIITGKGGEGKSRIGLVMKALLGENMNIGSIAKLEASPFARADLENRLVLVDDDLKMEALKQTNYIKSIITAELPMDLERKGIQSYQGELCARFMAFGNDTIQALHDRSHGFFRRQIILTTRERPANRKDDPYLGGYLTDEAEGILLWCMEGIRRLWAQQYQFTVSPRARRNLLESMCRGNNVEEFLRSTGYIQFTPEGSVSSKLLYEVYRDWCGDNVLPPLSAGSFWNYLNQNTARLGLIPSKHISAGNGKEVRGFRGVRACHRF